MDQADATAVVREALLSLPALSRRSPAPPITGATLLFESEDNGGLGLDSLDVIDAVMYVEDRLNRSFDVDVAQVLNGTVGELATLLLRSLEAEELVTVLRQK